MVILFVCDNAWDFNLPDTGQTKCYQAVAPYAEISCLGTDQDGEYNNNLPSYTDNGDGTVTDNNTGLMWQKEDDENYYDWDHALGVCASLALGDYSAWRLPTIRELISIVDYSVPFPESSINMRFFPNSRPGRQGLTYWSSTDVLPAPSTEAWNVYFYNGSANASSKGTVFNVRCVRGGEYPEQSLRKVDDTTVIDDATGLTWLTTETDYMNWDEAMSYCRSKGMRLPNIKELQSLMVYEKPAGYVLINTNIFRKVTWDVYWSSTIDTETIDPGQWFNAWGVNFDSGLLISHLTKNQNGAVRCVSGGQTGPYAITYPKGTVTINLGVPYANSTASTLTLSCADSGTGSSPIEFFNDNSLWSTPEICTVTKSWTSASGDGTRTVMSNSRMVQATDRLLTRTR
jgi:hypothetical protein